MAVAALGPALMRRCFRIHRSGRILHLSGMAWRIDEHILRGEIDNRTRGRVTGRIWLAGVEGPLVLDLRGDCHPDLAGCLLTFENPRPIPLTTRPPAALQRGEVGAITAARRAFGWRSHGRGFP